VRLTPPKIPTPLAQLRCMAEVHPDALYGREEGGRGSERRDSRRSARATARDATPADTMAEAARLCSGLGLGLNPRTGNTCSPMTMGKGQGQGGERQGQRAEGRGLEGEAPARPLQASRFPKSRAGCSLLLVSGTAQIRWAD
jgi:hypothetical protein